jgi:hypothetical protein
MQRLTLTKLGNFSLSLLLGLAAVLTGACSGSSHPSPEPASTQARLAADWTIASDPATPRPPFRFSKADDAFLDEVERGAFMFLWSHVDPATGMVPDRSSVTFASTAGVGFQLAAIPAGVERGWITHAEGQARCEKILAALAGNPHNRKAGLFYHYLEPTTAGPRDQDVVSTIDSAILFAGMLTAGEYFGGNVREQANALFDAVDWNFFVLEKPKPDEPYLKGFLTLGWKPRRFSDPTGDGKLLPYAWADAGDEQRLVTFLAVAAPDPAKRVDPQIYYRLRRMLGDHKGSGVHVWFPWSGALFTHFFSHCFLDYAHMGPDDPALAGIPRRPRVDWWENARRGVEFHRAKATEPNAKLLGLGENVWGLTASDAPSGYAVPGVYPQRIVPPDSVLQIDYSPFNPKDDLGDGTIAPYGAGCSMMFQPGPAIAALRHYRELPPLGGQPVWIDAPSGTPGPYGFKDAFNVSKDWVASDWVAIDQGPLVLAIENARSGLIWKVFHRSSRVQDALSRLGLHRQVP